MSQLHHCHPLRHEGTLRIARLVRALQPDAFRLDERSLQDLIVATHRYAQSLRYFDHSDQHPEHAYWDMFWEVEMLTYLAVVAVTDTDEIRRQYEAADAQFTKALGAQPVPGGGGTVNAQPYRPLLEMLRALALSLEEAYQKLVRIEHPLQNLLLARIKRDNCCDPDELVGALTRLIAYHKGAVKPLEWPEYAGFFAPDKRWGLVNRVDYDAIAANPNFAQEDLRELFVLLLDTWLVLKTAAQENFEAELARIELPEDVEYRIVQPHVVLFLVFLRLFRHAQDSINDLGARHLDYYYEQVLGLRRRDEIPDEVYLLFELAKDVDQFLLTKGTEFVAGKDKNGAPRFFEALEDWVLRPAQVADLKNTRIDQSYGRITANPDVKKVYAQGIEKPNESAKSWRSMGDDAHLPNGEVGFAIASPQLILREGKRVVDVTLKLTAPPAASLSWIGNPNLFQAYLSAEETWIKLEHRPDRVSAPEGPAPDLDRGAFNIFWNTSTPTTIRVRAVLERDDPPVVRLGEELAKKAGFDTQWPILKIILNPTLGVACPPGNPAHPTVAMYEMLRTLVVGEVVVRVEVKGIREHLIIQNDQGRYDGTEQVFPFGPQPKVGNFFYVGSTEVFQKALSDLKVNIQWIGAPDSFGEYYNGYVGANGNALPLNPKIQIDFIDRADVTKPEPKEKIETEAVGINLNIPIPTMAVAGEIVDISGSPGTLSVENNLQDYGAIVIQGKNIVSIPSALFGSDVFLKKNNSPKSPFSLAKTNKFKGYILDGITHNLVRVADHKDFLIEVKDEQGQGFPVTDVTVKIGNTKISANSNGQFLTPKTALIADLSVEVANYKTSKLFVSHYDGLSDDEFLKNSSIRVKLFSSDPVTPPVPTTPTSDTTISGTVVNRLGLPIPQADVSAYKGGNLQKIQTDANGDFSFTVPTGDTGWTLQAFFEGARSGKIPADADSNYTIQITKEIAFSNVFLGTLRGIVKSQDNGNPIWGTELRDAATDVLLGKTNESGKFEITGLSTSAGPVKVVHKSYAEPEIIFDITDNNSIEITLAPKPTYHIFTGQVVSFFNIAQGVPGVEIGVKGTGILARSLPSGNFEIQVPTDLALPVILTFSKSGFKIVEVNVSDFPNPVSAIKVILPEANPIELLITTSDNKRIIRDAYEVAINPLNVKRDIRTQDFVQYSQTLKRGFLRFKLVNGDFLHEEYQKVLVRQTLALADKKQGALVPNSPYSPSTNSISLDYTSEQTITGTANLGADSKPIDQFFHLLPFNGHKWLSLETGEIRLIYPYAPNDQPGAPVPYATGNLFVGIADLQPGSALSVLFEMAHGTEAEPEKLPPLIVWSYLGPDNAWLPFGTGQVLRDDTRGLTRTGMIQFAVPTDAVRQNTLLDPNFYWLRAAAVERNPDESVRALPSIAQVRAQVVRARFKNKSNELSHLAQPLPAQSIAALAESRAEVKAVEQPLESFGGSLPETAGMAFHQRISERLRHKDRAVTVWDFEHLLLEHFPEVAVAKCIQHTRYQPTLRASELAPGYVTVAVVPDLRKRHGEPWPQPRFPKGDLDDMRDYLASKANLFVAYGQGQEAHLQVVNPLYEQVDVRVHVCFRPEYADKAYYEQKLAEELTHFISPWLADPSVPPGFGRVLERSQILQFIEERPYIDFVDLSKNPDGTYKNFQIRIVCVNVAGQTLGADGLPLPGQKPDEEPKEHYAADKVCPSTARSILVAGSVAVNTGLPDLAPCPKPSTTTGGSTTIPDQTQQTGQAAYALVADVAKAADAPALPKKTAAKKSRKTKQ